MIENWASNLIPKKQELQSGYGVLIHAKTKFTDHRPLGRLTASTEVDGLWAALAVMVFLFLAAGLCCISDSPHSKSKSKSSEVILTLSDPILYLKLS